MLVVASVCIVWLVETLRPVQARHHLLHAAPGTDSQGTEYLPTLHILLLWIIGQNLPSTGVRTSFHFMRILKKLLASGVDLKLLGLDSLSRFLKNQIKPRKFLGPQLKFFKIFGQRSWFYLFLAFSDIRIQICDQVHNHQVGILGQIRIRIEMVWLFFTKLPTYMFFVNISQCSLFLK